LRCWRADIDFASFAYRSVGAFIGASWLTGSSFWVHCAAAVLFAIGVYLTLRKNAKRAHGLERLIAFGPLFFAWPLAVFGAQHFVFLRDVRNGVPSWMPGHVFWAVLVGTALIAAALSMITGIQSEVAALMVGVMLFLFVLLLYVPNLIQNPGDLGVTALLRDLSLSGGALALAGTLADQGRWRGLGWLAVLGRVFFAVAVGEFGVENIVHPNFAPVVPEPNLMTPAWIPGHMVWAFLTGAILVAGSIALLLNWRTRLAAAAVGIWFFVLLIVLYMPMEIVHPSIEISGELDQVAQTMAMCGAALLVAGAQKSKDAELSFAGAGQDYLGS